jgi:1,2-phenylacetyl-CoA epoxidase catalytic subunit
MWVFLALPRNFYRNPFQQWQSTISFTFLVDKCKIPVPIKRLVHDVTALEA